MPNRESDKRQRTENDHSRIQREQERSIVFKPVIQTEDKVVRGRVESSSTDALHSRSNNSERRITDTPQDKPTDTPDIMRAGSDRYEPTFPITHSDISTYENQPFYTQNETGDYLIQQIKGIHLDIRIEWNREAQQAAIADKGLAVTYNFNGNLDPKDMGPDKIFVALGPDATNAAIYEEYLHVMEAAKRGWAPPKSSHRGPIEKIKEEIRVEHRVLTDAANIGMFNDEFDELRQGRREYIKMLCNYLGKTESKLPKDIQPYLADPAKPDNLPTRNI